jgi:hypothetical protein
VWKSDFSDYSSNVLAPLAHWRPEQLAGFPATWSYPRQAQKYVVLEAFDLQLELNAVGV